MVKEIMEYIRTYPGFDDDSIFTADYLAEDIMNYSLETEPGEEVVETFIDGSSINQFFFILSSREVSDAYSDINLRNTMFYENFASWIKLKNISKEYPLLEGPFEAIEIDTDSPVYVLQVEPGKSKYVIHMRLKYFFNPNFINKGGIW